MHHDKSHHRPQKVSSETLRTRIALAKSMRNLDLRPYQDWARQFIGRLRPEDKALVLNALLFPGARWLTPHVAAILIVHLGWLPNGGIAAPNDDVPSVGARVRTRRDDRER